MSERLNLLKSRSVENQNPSLKDSVTLFLSSIAHTIRRFFSMIAHGFKTGWREGWKAGKGSARPQQTTQTHRTSQSEETLRPA